MLLKKCFWCKHQLGRNNKTKDHLICRFLRNKSDPTRRYKAVPCCKRCNRKRSRISQHCHNIKTFNDENKLKKSIVKLFNHVTTDDINHFRKIICHRLQGTTKEICLREIDVVLDYIKKNTPPEVIILVE